MLLLVVCGAAFFLVRGALGQAAREVAETQNAWRVLHARAPLRWSDALATEAQAWAEETVRRRQLGMGAEHQNLAWSAGEHWPATKAPCLWYAEGNGGPHFRQMLSNAATLCGIGIARDPEFGTVVVANYDEGWGDGAPVTSICPHVLRQCE